MEEYLKEFLHDRQCEGRYASFDYCYNYFYSFYKRDKLRDLSLPENIQMSCLQIGFYLASWGMFRGSSKITQKSVKYFEPLIKWISEADKKFWEIDVDSYNDENVRQKLIEAFNEIRKVLRNGQNINVSIVLVTKIMLGIFSNVPAFDVNVKHFFQINNNRQTIGDDELIRIYTFYTQNRDLIDKYSANIHTFDFSSCKQTNINYKKAKIIDMIGFIGGQHGTHFNDFNQ